MLGMYSCYGIPYPHDQWQGSGLIASLEERSPQNSMGWCNATATHALVDGENTTLSQTERQQHYAVFQDLFAEEVPTLPLFIRADASPANFAWEHLSFNLETFDQSILVAPETQAELYFQSYEGSGTVTVPAGTFASTVEVIVHPLDESSAGAPYGLTNYQNFQLEVFENGQIVSGPLVNPIQVKLNYNPLLLPSPAVEDSLSLYYWDGTAWQDAAATCVDGNYLRELDRGNKTLTVNICHLSEFNLSGRNAVFLPITIR